MDATSAQHFVLAMSALFGGLTELEAMKAENAARARKDSGPAYGETEFMLLAQRTQEHVRACTDWIRS